MSRDVPWGTSPPGFQSPDQSRVGSVRLLVADLNRSVGYYRQVIGLHLHERAGGFLAGGFAPTPHALGRRDHSRRLPVKRVPRAPRPLK